MKKILNILFLALFSPLVVFAQANPQTTCIPMMEQVIPYLENIEEDYYTVNRIEFDLILEGRTKSTPIYLYKNKEYHLLVIGDKTRINDIDFSIYYKDEQQKWQMLKSVETDGNRAELMVTPLYTGYYELEFELDEDKENSKGRFALIVYY